MFRLERSLSNIGNFVYSRKIFISPYQATTIKSLYSISTMTFASAPGSQCGSIVCLNGGQCVNTACECSPPYSGRDCSTFNVCKFEWLTKSHSTDTHTHEHREAKCGVRAYLHRYAEIYVLVHVRMCSVNTVLCNMTLCIGDVVDCNGGVCIPDPTNGLDANCLCPKNASGQFCDFCKC